MGILADRWDLSRFPYVDALYFMVSALAFEFNPALFWDAQDRRVRDRAHRGCVQEFSELYGLSEWVRSHHFFCSPQDWPPGIDLQVPPFFFANWCPRIGGKSQDRFARHCLEAYACGMPIELLVCFTGLTADVLLRRMRDCSVNLMEHVGFVLWAHQPDLSLIPKKKCKRGLKRSSWWSHIKTGRFPSNAEAFNPHRHFLAEPWSEQRYFSKVLPYRRHLLRLRDGTFYGFPRRIRASRALETGSEGR